MKRDDKKRNFKVYFYQMRFTTLLYDECIKDVSIINTGILEKACNHYNEASKAQDFAALSWKPSTDDNTTYLVSKLKFESNVLFGEIGCCMERLPGLYRERNTGTLATLEISPSDSCCTFEAYTYFALSAITQKLAIFWNGNVTPDIDGVIVNVLLKMIQGSPYGIACQQLLDQDIKSRLQNLGNNIIIKGYIKNAEKLVSSQKMSFRQIETSLGKDVIATVKFKVKVYEKLTEQQIEDLLSLQSDKDYASVRISDMDETKEVIDIIRRSVAISSVIKLTEADSKDCAIVWDGLKNLIYVAKNVL